MKRTILFSILSLSFTSICFGQSNTTESLSVTTYFPAPYGVYRYLKLNPTDEVPSLPALSPGVMFYNNGSDMIQYRNIAGDWVNLTGGGGGGGDYWVYSDSTKALNNTNTNGYVRINGAGTGGELLQVNGDVRFRNRLTDTLLYITRNNTGNASVVFDTNGSSDKYIIRTTGASPGRLAIGNATQDFVTMNNAGYVGIGTTSPGYKLHVAGITGAGAPASQTLVRLEGDGTPTLAFYSASNTFHDEPQILSRRMRGSITGIWSAVQKDDSLLAVRGYGYTGNGYQQAAFMQFSADDNFNPSSSPGRISFWTTPDNSVIPEERMVLKNDGKVAVGTNTAGRTPDPSFPFQVFTDTSGLVYGYVEEATGNWRSSSDKRIKKNVSVIKDALAKIIRVQGVRYDLLTETSPGSKRGRYLGFIGQDLEKEFPELVSTDSRGYKSVAYGSMTPVLVEAIKEQQKQIESLRKDLEALKALN